jgi:hypothetical protein
MKKSYWKMTALKYFPFLSGWIDPVPSFQQREVTIGGSGSHIVYPNQFATIAYWSVLLQCCGFTRMVDF